MGIVSISAPIRAHIVSCVLHAPHVFVRSDPEKRWDSAKKVRCPYKTQLTILARIAAYIKKIAILPDRNDPLGKFGQLGGWLTVHRHKKNTKFRKNSSFPRSFPLFCSGVYGVSDPPECLHELATGTSLDPMYLFMYNQFIIWIVHHMNVTIDGFNPSPIFKMNRQIIWSNASENEKCIFPRLSMSNFQFPNFDNSVSRSHTIALYVDGVSFRVRDVSCSNSNFYEKVEDLLLNIDLTFSLLKNEAKEVKVAIAYLCSGVAYDDNCLECRRHGGTAGGYRQGSPSTLYLYLLIVV